MRSTFPTDVIHAMSRKTQLACVFTSLLLCFATLTGAADLTVNRSEIVVGENVTVKLKRAPAFSDVDWAHTPELAKLEAERGKIRLRGAAAGLATVTVSIDGKPEGSISIKVIEVAGAASSGVVSVPAPNPAALPASPVTVPPLAEDPGGRDFSSRMPATPATRIPATPAARISLTQTSQLTLIQTYHWNNGLGAQPGSLALIDEQGRRYGPWPATGSPGPGGIANIYWNAQPMLTLPAGSYTVVDSDPATWTPDMQNGGRGFSRHEVLPVMPGYAQAAVPGQASPGSMGSPAVMPGQVGSGYSGAWPAPNPAGLAVAGQARALLDIANGNPVAGSPVKPSKLDLNTPHVVTLIRTTHWNAGRGAAPGSIGLRCRDGSQHGPWQARGESGPDGVANAYWIVQPNVQLPACVCSVQVSDPASWSHNEASKKRGFVHIEGYPVGYASKPPSAPGDSMTGTTLETLDRAHEAVRKMDETKRALESLRSIFK